MSANTWQRCAKHWPPRPHEPGHAAHRRAPCGLAQSMSRPRPAVEPARVERLRRLCLALPEAREEAAWVGTRWVIGKKAFAHVLRVEGGRPPAYARALGRDGPDDVLTFRSPLAEFNAFAFTQAPFFRPGWWPDIVGIALAEPVDWEEVGLLVVASYRALAPKRLSEALPGRAAAAA